MIHRDVSPHNIMIASDGTARLLDFGIAKASVAAHVTRENSFKGKIAYSAPEQREGGATQASDLFAFGVVLWELLAGVRMHQGASGSAEGDVSGENRGNAGERAEEQQVAGDAEAQAKSGQARARAHGRRLDGAIHGRIVGGRLALGQRGFSSLRRLACGGR